VSKPQFQKNQNKHVISRVIMPKLINELRIYVMYFLVTVTVTTLVYALVKNYAFIPVQINGDSMVPFHNSNDKIFIDKLTPLFSTYLRGEVVVLLPNIKCDPNGDLFIKRVVGLPGEKVIFKNGGVYISNAKISDVPILLDESDYLPKSTKTYKNLVATGDLNLDNSSIEEEQLGENEYYFLGDNRSASQDSRRCGKINKQKILGREVYKWFPESQKGYFKLPIYKNISN
jgi:signal peptidase I